VSGSSGGTRTAGPSSTAGSTGGTAVGRPGSRSNNSGSPVVGQANARTGSYYGGRFYNGSNRYYRYDPFYLYGYGAFGLGSLYYDPFWWGGYPYGYGYGYGYPWGYGGYYGGGYYGGGYGGGYGGAYDDQAQDGVKGGLKLKVTPKDAEVYVDGYYVGVVNDYDGAFQRLNLVAGPHHIEIKAKGFETLVFDVKVEPRETISYHGDLQPAQK
jgi:hypothetical protein